MEMEGRAESLKRMKFFFFEVVKVKESRGQENVEYPDEVCETERM